MKTINWCVCIAFGIIAFLAVIASIVFLKFEYFCIAFACGCVSRIAYIDIKDSEL